jgi:NhaA family Na+:H+ antiporter
VVDAGVGAFAHPVALGAVLGLVVGKTVGVLGATWAVQRFTRVELAEGLSWWDVLGLSVLAGIGFTVSLLIGELAYGAGSEVDGEVKIGVLTGSVLSALVASVILRIRNAHYRRMEAEEAVDSDLDGVPDVYERGEDR